MSEFNYSFHPTSLAEVTGMLKDVPEQGLIEENLATPPTSNTIPAYQIAASESPSTSLDRIANDVRREANYTFSETILTDPTARLEFSTEASLYLASKHSREPDYAGSLDRLYATIPIEERMAPAEVSVCIAAASHQEGASLYDSLKLYTEQNTDRPHEIIVFLNRPAQDTDGKPTDDTAAKEAIATIRAEHPELRLITFEEVYEEEPNIGHIKRTLHDMTIKLHQERGTKDPILVFNDADSVHIDKSYLKTIAETFAADPMLDGISGVLEWDSSALISNPELLVATRVYQYINAVTSSKSGHVIFAGANMIMRGSAYCAAGGGKDGRRGEDVTLGLQLQAMRRDKRNIQEGGRDIILETSARRTLFAHDRGLAPNEKWMLGFSAFDSGVRSYLSTFTPYDFANPDKRYLLTENIQDTVNRTLGVYETVSPIGLSSNLYRFALGRMGLLYDVDHDPLGRQSVILNRDIHTLIGALSVNQANYEKRN
ncbi:MAG: hypothetical protein WDN27_00300 [Candidatus Saccharibacteria bacterium]